MALSLGSTYTVINAPSFLKALRGFNVSTPVKTQHRAIVYLGIGGAY
jgi:hypothetical protein